MDCPACHKPLIVVEFEQVELDYCPACEGSWFDAGELELILGRAGTRGGGTMPAKGRKSGRRCPHCNRKMAASLFPGSAVAADACRAGHGVWLDKGELAAIARSGGETAETAALASLCERVFGGGRSDLRE